MSISEFLSLASGVGGGNIDKKEVQSALDQYENYRAHCEETEEEKKSSYGDVVSKFYDLTACLYELCWGESIHLAHRYKGETLRESLKRHEHFLALQLALKPGMKVLDVGCGVGGPLREIARFSSTSITGLNNNEYQINRGRELNSLAGLDKSCDYVKADFMKMPFPDNTFDAIYAIESTCYAADWLGCFKEIYRVLKPGQCFAVYEWCLTDSFDPKNETHQKIKKAICVGTSAPDIRVKNQCLETLEHAGFEVIWDRDLAADSPVPFYQTVDTSTLSLNNFLTTALGRYLSKKLLKSIEYVGIAPAGSHKVASLLESGIEAQAEGGKHEIFSPMYFVLVRKPHQETQKIL